MQDGKRYSSTNNNNSSFLHSYYYGENGGSPEHAAAPLNAIKSNHTKSQTLGRAQSRRETCHQNNLSHTDYQTVNKPISKPARPSKNFELQKTKSNDSIMEAPSLSQLSRAGKLQKTKSSTFISPEQQSENMFYKSKVTLTLRRSRQNLNEDLESCSSPTSAPKQTYYYGESLPPEKPPLPCLPTERILRRAEELRSQCPTPPPLMSKPSLQKTVRCPFLFYSGLPQIPLDLKPLLT